MPAEPSRESLHHEVRQFLLREARLLDRRQFEEWLDLLTSDIEYKIPGRAVKERGRDEYGDSYYVHDNRWRLEKRVEKIETGHTWSENPPSKTRHFVTNVLVDREEDDELPVTSNLLLAVNYHWDDSDDPGPHLLSAERVDRLRRDEDGLKLSERTVYLDQSILTLDNLSFFI